MGIFRRRRRRAGEPLAPTPDAALPMLEVDGAARLRRLVQRGFAARGIEVSLADDHVLAADGQVYGLWNLAVACAGAPGSEWPDAVARHLDGLLTPDTLESLDDEQLADQTYLRVSEEASVRPEWHSGTRELAPGVVAILCVDLPTIVSTPTVAHWEERGGLARWREIGSDNLLGLVADPTMTHRLMSQDGASFSVLLGDSFFTASLSLCLTDVMLHHGGEADHGRGVLMAVPNRHQLVWRVIDGPEAVVAMNAMIRFTVSGYDHGAGAVSPHLYWVHDGRWDQITSREDDAVSVNVSPELGVALGLAD